MSKIRNYWLGLPIGSKMKAFILLLLLVVFIASGFNVYTIQFSVVDVNMFSSGLTSAIVNVMTSPEAAGAASAVASASAAGSAAGALLEAEEPPESPQPATRDAVITAQRTALMSFFFIFFLLPCVCCFPDVGKKIETDLVKL